MVSLYPTATEPSLLTPRAVDVVTPRVPRSVMTFVALVQRKAWDELSEVLPSPTTTEPSLLTSLANDRSPPGRVPRSVMALVLLVQRKAYIPPESLLLPPTTTE